MTYRVERQSSGTRVKRRRYRGLEGARCAFRSIADHYPNDEVRLTKRNKIVLVRRAIQ